MYDLHNLSATLRGGQDYKKRLLWRRRKPRGGKDAYPLVTDNEGIAKRGLIIRHLVLPGLRLDSMSILDWIEANIPAAHVSLMSQYIPAGLADKYPEINRRITTFEYESVVEHFFDCGLKNGYMQDRDSAAGDYVPEF